MPEPREAFDADALEIEATGEPFVFTLGGKNYTMPAVMDFRVASYLRDGDFGGAVELLVGPDQWQAILKGAGVLTMERAIGIWTAYAAHLGTTPGKSRASRRSSKSTASRSKPTSSGTTG